MTPDTIRLDQNAKEQLIRLKRRTGIKTWNVLCRWALARSLSEPSVPAGTPGPRPWALEIDWGTFAGSQSTAIRSVLTARLLKEKTPANRAGLEKALDAHLHRGVAYLAGTKGSVAIEDLVMTR